MAEQIQWGSGRVRAMRDLTPDIRLFEIEPASNFVVPTPGSHINVTVQINERPDVRSYSTVGPCNDGVYRIAVKLLPASRGGSAYMWSLAPNALIAVSAPRNHFELGLGRPEYLLLAGGIGITPIFSLALALARTDANFKLLYAARRRQDLALASELQEHIGERLHPYVDEEGAQLDLAAQISQLAPDGELYVCGPIGLLEAAKRTWAQSGRPIELLRFETFGNSGRYATQSFTVNIPRLSKVVEIPQNQSMLDALEAAGIEMISDCRRGECGLCAVKVLSAEGAIDHRDVFFSDEEKAANDQMCTCVSRVAGGSITIDTADRIG
jgi:vanillate O-demethylase ferredoxin subunit